MAASAANNFNGLVGIAGSPPSLNESLRQSNVQRPRGINLHSMGMHMREDAYILFVSSEPQNPNSDSGSSSGFNHKCQLHTAKLSE
ncbi:hypothetical protein GX48_02713 [Paracoccidioides brasiliensis]|nr:hypothetical protein GX48_02713 [Paracoccidioides brasiliensis]